MAEVHTTECGARDGRDVVQGQAQFASQALDRFRLDLAVHGLARLGVGRRQTRPLHLRIEEARHG